MRKKETFIVDGKEYAVLEPSPKQGRDAQTIFNKTFSQALKDGVILRKALDRYAREQGVWTEEQAIEYESLTRELLEKEKKLKGGGIRLDEAKKIAIDMRRIRFQMMSLSSDRDSLDDTTAEGQAENTRFNYLVSLCLVDNKTGKPIFSSLEDYEENGNTQVAFEGARILARMIHGLESDYEDNLPENQFLKKFKFVNEELRLVDKDGRLVDTEGRLVDEFGRLINEDGHRIDIDGNLLTDSGEYDIEEKPFLDEDGNPIVIDEEEQKSPEVSEDTEETQDKTDEPVSQSEKSPE